MQDVPSRNTVNAVADRIKNLAWRWPPRWVWLIAGLFTALLILLTLLLSGEGTGIPPPEVVDTTRHPAAVTHEPPFIPPPRSPHILLCVIALDLVRAVISGG